MTQAENILFREIFGAVIYESFKQLKIHPSALYKEACKLCFLQNKQGPVADALRRTVIWMDSGVDDFRGSMKHDELLQF